MAKFLMGKDYPHLCKSCQAAVDNCAMILTEGGLDTDNVEAPSDMAYDQRLFCGGHCCLGPWKRGQVAVFDGIRVTLKTFTGGGFWIAIDEHGNKYYPRPDGLSPIDDGYAAWLDEVDAVTESLVGVAQSELPDWPSRVVFDDGVSPDEAARRTITEVW